MEVPEVRLIVPYARIIPEVRSALPPTAEWVDVSTSDDAYYNLLSDLWAAREGFLLVEQDIVPPPLMLPELAACPAPWCACGYEFENLGLLYGLGCVKFGAELMAQVPNAWDMVAQQRTQEHPAKHWCRLDDNLKAVLGRRGIHSHHHGTVRHLSTVRSHRPCH